MLLKNDGVLPLEREPAQDARGHRTERRASRSSAATPMCRSHIVTMLEGIQEKLGEPCKVVNAEGVRITDSGDWWRTKSSSPTRRRNRAAHRAKP